ncbi:tektin-B1-like [Colias croceus]|uniref:tektin-B1-like n=1 Tax=Colias crocea TaxID=72248 RepID=UPI001E27EB76|nr:tektin-B1-like [Colias croceus]
MFCEDACLGHSNGLDKIRNINDRLNAEVVEQINGSQELVMLSNFARESHEYNFKKSLQERISDVTSWRWVLDDLSKRLEEAIVSLKYEDNALKVVVQRIEDEIREHSTQGTRPGAMSPLRDAVEDAIIQEYNFLREEKKKFEKLVPELTKQILLLEKTKKRIECDILNKDQAISVDETCVDKDYRNAKVENWKGRKKKGLSMKKWEKRCALLKRAGLRALRYTIVTRLQVRGARVQLSIAAQAMATRVDTILRRRYHTNSLKLEDLKWQKQEAIRDLKSLEEEQSQSEYNLLQIMDQERIVEARIIERARKPGRELIKDDADRKSKYELIQTRLLAKELRKNIERIASLQDAVANAITKIDCTAEDLSQVLLLDESRIRSRTGEVPIVSSGSTLSSAQSHSRDRSPQPSDQLTVIQEENEDDYPFDF